MDSYPNIADHGLISIDFQTVALLDAERGGFFRIVPDRDVTSAGNRTCPIPRC